jgi:hypothetical protein
MLSMHGNAMDSRDKIIIIIIMTACLVAQQHMEVSLVNIHKKLSNIG